MNHPPAPPSGAPPKNGPSGLAIFGFGCVGLAILLAIGGAVLGYKGWQKAKDIYAEAGGDPTRVAARMMIKMNPDLELVSTDDAQGQMTIRDKKSGEVITLSIDEVAKGKFTVKGADGSETAVDVSQGSGGTMTVKSADGSTTLVTGGGNAPLPAWVSVYPGGETLPGGLHSESGEGITGTHQAQTGDPVAKVKDTIEARWKAAGYQTETAATSAGGAEMATIQGSKDDGKYTLQAVITTDQGKTQIVTSYQGPKQ